MVSHAYRLNGIVCKKREKPSPFVYPVTAAAQLEIGAIMQIGAAVASMI